MLTGRLERLAQQYREQHGIDVRDLEGSGAAGGLAGGLAALGGRLVPGFELVADEVDLVDHLRGADLVITGEGHLDAQSFQGKVVGGVVAEAAELGLPVHVVCGDADEEVLERVPVTVLARRFGLERALREPTMCIEEAVREVLASAS
jgi:glycerate kinase